MWYAITVDFGRPDGDNEVLMEAMAAIGGRQIAVEHAWQQWVVDTPNSLESVRYYLMRHSRDDHRVHVVALPIRLRMLKYQKPLMSERATERRPLDGPA